MMWGFFLWQELAILTWHRGVPGILDSLKYQAILKRNMMPSVDKLILGDHWTFQQHNDPIDTSKLTKAWLKKKILECPGVAFSAPDLICRHTVAYL